MSVSAKLKAPRTSPLSKFGQCGTYWTQPKADPVAEGKIQAQFKGVVLLILDGWGISPHQSGNAINLAHKPNFDYLITHYPHCSIAAAGEEAGLTWGEVGNSEVGHYNIGAGRVIWQNLARINNSIFDNSFFRNSVLIQACQTAKKNKSHLHLIGLVSQGGVHSHIDHLLALLTLVSHHGSPETYIHYICDGRDSPPKIALEDIKKIENKLKSIKNTRISTISGRYYAMDRDKRWKRTQSAYNAMVYGKAKSYISAREAIEVAYQQNLTDEFIPPSIIIDKNQTDSDIINDNDSIVFFNFREDRMIQLVKAFYDQEFSQFPVKNFQNLQLTSFVQYTQTFNFPVAFPPQSISNTLPEVISKAGFNQLHLAETEKYAHVTYFLNGGKEQAVPNEDRILVSSPKVATYDLKPEMSVNEIVRKACENIQKQKYQFLAINFANPDMVGHTGNLKATIQAVEACDKAVKNLVQCAIQKQYAVLITADHGNAEEMFTAETGQVSKDHTSNPVPLIYVAPDNQKNNLGQNEIASFSNSQPIGVLADIAPTVLDLLTIPKPKEMTGYSLINILI